MSVSSSNMADVPSGIPEVWGRVPQRNKNFTGREELLEQLRSGLATAVTAVVPTALHGLGGVGKTQVAVEYAYRYAGNYDLVWWISADQPVLVRSSLAALAPYLGLQPATATGIEDAAGAVLDALRRGQPYKRWLLIFDNADQPEDISNILPRGPGHVLVTSRNHRWQGVVDTVPVDVFSRAESVAFLNKRVPKGVDAGEAMRLAEQLGDLPLALEQAAALQAETGMSIEEYLRLFNEHTAKLLAEGKPSEYPVSMTVAWSLSVSQLKDKMPEAVELLRCCAFFGPEPIPRDVFVPLAYIVDSQPPPGDPLHRTATGPVQEITLGPHQGIAVDPQLGILLDDPILLSTAIRELGRYALARIDAASRTIQVHRLVQALLRDELAQADRVRIRHVTHLLLANAGPKKPDMRSNWPRYEELLAHADPSRVVQCPHPLVRVFCLDVVRFLYVSGNPRAARSFIERTIERWVQDSGEEDRYVLEARRHLGIVLRELGDYRAAFDLNRVTLEGMLKVLGPEHEQTLLLTNSHGADLRARGEFEKARVHDEDSLRRHESAFGPADRRTLRCANNLAVDYGLISDYKVARRLHMETFQRQRSPGSGVSAQDTLICWNGLARIVRLSGNYTEAVDLGEDAFAYGVHELGAQHPWTLRTAKDLSIARRMSGATSEGMELAEDTYDREQRSFGPNHPDTLAAAMNLANARRTAGSIEEGFTLASDTMTRYPAVYGPDHPYNHGCTVNLAMLLRARGDAEAARELDEKSLAGLVDGLGHDHHYTLICALSLASDLASLGNAGAARELGEDSLSRLRQLLGENHPMTIACAANLVHDLRADGSGEEADRLAADTLARYDRVLGLDHPDAMAFLDNRRLDFDFDPPPI
jgi:tetratricopeptide (TPR) repeat protein